MNISKISLYSSFFLLTILFSSCKSEPAESEFTKAAREVFFDVDFSLKYDDAVAYYNSNPNLVNAKLFDSASPLAGSKHQFIFQKHPLVKEGLKAGSLNVSRYMTDSANFQEVMYFQTKDDALKTLQSIDQLLRKPSSQVTTTDTADRKMVIYAGGKTDPVKAIVANVNFDPEEDRGVLTLNLVKSRN